MPDICTVILDQHEDFRRRFGDLDDRHDESADALTRLWEPLADLLDRHAAVEERISTLSSSTVAHAP